MAISSVTEYFDDTYNTAWNNVRKGFIQEAYEATPFYFEVMLRNRKRHEGGKRFDVPIQYGGNTTKKWLGSKTDTVSTDEDQKTADASYTMKVIAINVSRYKDDELAAYGNTRATQNLVEITLGDAKASVIDEMEDVAASDGSQDANAPEGIPQFVNEAPSSQGAVAGITTSSYSWWQNKIKDMSGLSPVGNLEREMRILYKNTGRKAPGIKGASRFPNIGFGGIDAHTYYEDEVDDRTINYKLAETKGGAGALGFDRVHFKTVWIWWSPAFNATSIFLLNSNYIEYRVHPLDEFSMTEWKQKENQPRVRHAQITTTCCIVFLSRTRHGVLFDIGE